MITYVNSVLVSNLAGAVIFVPSEDTPLEQTTNTASTHAGKFLVLNMDSGAYISTATGAERIKIGLITAKNSVKIAKDGTRTYMPVIKWSNIIQKGDLKAYSEVDYADYVTASVSAEDTVTIDFTGLKADVLQSFAQGGKRIIVRLTFKDMPTRFRKWTESYEYVTQKDDTKATIATGIANLINKQWKRARVIAKAVIVAEDKSKNVDASEKVELTAMPYDDDNSVDSINVANKVRFAANVYYTDPDAAAFASRNKYFPTGVVISKVAGVTYPAAAKLVRDHEAQAMGYEGILNRGCCTWPIIKPEMAVDLSANYNAYTLEFENSYRAADDIQRRTKQTLEIFVKYNSSTTTSGISTFLSAFASDVKKADVVYPSKD